MMISPARSNRISVPLIGVGGVRQSRQAFVIHGDVTEPEKVLHESDFQMRGPNGADL